MPAAALSHAMGGSWRRLGVDKASQLCYTRDMKKQVLFLRVTQEVENKWRAYAGHLGFVHDRGPTMGAGNVSALLTALANGDVKFDALQEAMEEVQQAFAS